MLKELSKLAQAFYLLVFSGMLSVTALISFVSFFLLFLDQDERWFSRLALGLVCVGFLYVGQEIGNLKE